MDSDINSSLEHSAQVRLKLLRMNEIVNTIQSYNIVCNFIHTNDMASCLFNISLNTGDWETFDVWYIIAGCS